jgi:hypothetical protein
VSKKIARIWRIVSGQPKSNSGQDIEWPIPYLLEDLTIKFETRFAQNQLFYMYFFTCISFRH